MVGVMEKAMRFWKPTTGLSSEDKADEAKPEEDS